MYKLFKYRIVSWGIVNVNLNEKLLDIFIVIIFNNK